MRKNIKVVNCTPHDVVIVKEDDFYVIEKSGIIPRLKEVQTKLNEINFQATKLDEVRDISVDIVQKSFNEIEGLPEKQEGTIYVVSALVAGAAKDRDDLFVPNDTVRDENGRIIGCRNLARI
jgi:hypothetical protein